MEVKNTAFDGLVIIVPRIFEDNRGYFYESYNQETYKKAGIPYLFVQDNQSESVKGVIRGLHYQLAPYAQTKLVRVIAGTVLDVAVDLRRRSPTFGQWTGAVLSADNKLQLWIPPGFAHGFYTLSETVDLIYKVTDYYAPEWERTLLWNDPQLNIAWPLVNDQPPILSAKDVLGKPLAEADVFEW